MSRLIGIGARASAVLLWLLAAPALAQRVEKPRANDPASCPYCRGEPAAMARAGIASHGGFEFGNSDTAAADALLASDVRWIESAHFEIGVALGAYRPAQSEKKKLRAELEQLAAVLPSVDPKTKLLDPWLRAHLFAQRAEQVWERMLGLLRVRAEAFPDGKKPWDLTGEYMGEGPHLGQKGKYEVLMLPSKAEHLAYLTKEFGLQIQNTQRWNVIARDTLTVTIHAEQGGLRSDTAMHGHLAFNLAHNLLDGYKHYSYDTPIWIHEGLAHFLEREIDPSFNTFDSSEGGIAEETRKSKWHQETQKLVRQKNVPRMAELISLRSYAELDLEDHFATWSMITYLIETNPEGFACLLRSLCTLLNEKNAPDGSNMKDHHRDAFQKCLGLGYPEFDQAWRDWVLGVEPEPEDDVDAQPL